MTCDDALRILENADRICNERVIDAENAVEEAFKAVDKLKTAIVLPEGATNGDVIKAMFPTSEAIFMLSNVAKTDVIKITNEAFLVERAWWNAPYERGE